MFINLIFYILELVEISRHFLFNKLFSGSKLLTLFHNKIELIENQLRQLTFVSLVMGVIIIFYSLKFTFRIFCLVFNKLLSPSKENKVHHTRKEISSEDIGKLVNFQGFSNVDFEFKDEPQDKQEVISKFAKLKEEEDRIQLSSNYINAPIFTKDLNIQKVANESLKSNLFSNLLHPQIFSSSRFIESEIIRISLELFKGNEDCCGITSYGGTESILLALLAYRNYGESRGITNPEVIVTTTAHVGFNKACDCFGIKLVEVPVNKSFEMDIEMLKKKINKNTICIGASYPNNINGICDNIQEIAKIASKFEIPFHVDAGLGGLLTAFYKDQALPKCDFTIKGITSISIDFHRYGVSPLGISVVMYSDRTYRKNHYFIYNQWSGGIYPCPGFPGSRSPATLVAAFSLLMYLGKNYYVKQSRTINEGVEKICKFVKKELNGDIEIVGDPKICLLAFKGKKIGYIYNCLKQKKWQLNFCYNPYGFQYLVTLANIDKIDIFLNDLKDVNTQSKCYDKIDTEFGKYSIPNEYYDSYIDYMLDFVKN